MSPFLLSLKLAAWTTLLLVPASLFIGRWLARGQGAVKPWVESLIYLPLVLPPTVIGYYLLRVLSPNSASGEFLSWLTGQSLVFTFPGLVIASLIVNLPFAIQPIQLAFSNLPEQLREAAWVSGLSTVKTWWHIELPLIWPGILASATLVFAHTLGEFGVVLLVGGNIEGTTRTVSIAIYDSVQSFDMTTAGLYSLILLIVSLLSLLIVRINSHSRIAPASAPASPTASATETDRW
ncbi:MAG: molybdate ABC transporter permease subunit [Granulosicoccus sp.]|nr:molybdate ABC transporter permease subunit [Granulosicoccus sp.]